MKVVNNRPQMFERSPLPFRAEFSAIQEWTKQKIKAGIEVRRASGEIVSASGI
jgi:hypothetical protein